MLKRLELVGFKSFADKTQFDFPAGITAIVGPNGSGKSNLVDAVRWVLGEQSAKSLRGGEMSDVIFNGSASRRSHGMAEVTLTFDNARRSLASDAEEIQSSRLKELRVGLGLQDYHVLARQRQEETARLDELRTSLQQEMAQAQGWQRDLLTLEQTLATLDEAVREQETQLADANQRIIADS